MSTGTPLSLCAIVLTAACSQPLTQSDAERLVRSALGDAPTIECAWEGQVTRIDRRHGRLTAHVIEQGGERIEQRPEDLTTCLSAMRSAGVVEPGESTDTFTLGRAAAFSGTRDVVFPCHTGDISRVDLAPEQSDTARAFVTVVPVHAMPAASVWEQDHGCLGGSLRGTACTAHFERADGWHLVRFEGPGCEAPAMSQ